MFHAEYVELRSIKGSDSKRLEEVGLGGNEDFFRITLTYCQHRAIDFSKIYRITYTSHNRGSYTRTQKLVSTLRFSSRWKVEIEVVRLSHSLSLCL